MNEDFMDYDFAERIKQEGWSLLTNDKSDYEKAQIFVKYIIYGHYWRCRNGVNAQSRKRTILKNALGKKYTSKAELEFDDYVEHWLWSNGERLCGKEVMKEIKTVFHYEPKQSPGLKEGNTIYDYV